MTRLLLPACLFVLASCVNPGGPAQRQARAAALAADLRALGPQVDAAEAERAAAAAVHRAADMAELLQPMAQPWLNNALINTGIRKGGLCYHWRNGIYRALEPLGLQTLDLRFARARGGTMREHNSVVLSVPGAPLADGIVLDGWRHGGVLWWGRLGSDKYPWVEVPVELEPRSLRAASAGAE